MKLILLSSIVFVGTMLITAVGLRAQTMTGTILTQPCNNNGQIAVTVTGLTPPINYTCFRAFGFGPVYSHSAMPTASDVFTLLPAFLSNGFNPNAWTITAWDGTNSAMMTISLTPAFNVSVTVAPAVCPAMSTVQAIVTGGTAPFVYAWTNTLTSLVYTTNPAQVPNGSYTLSVTDAAGCNVRSVNDSIPPINTYTTPSFNIALGGSIANCTNGTASVTSIFGGVPPYTFMWSNSAVSQNISGLTQGWYTCVVTDAVGCQNSDTYLVSQAVNLSINFVVANSTCLQANGSVTTFVSGGTAPYTYFWNNGATTANLPAVVGGQYLVQITDAIGCTGSGGVNLLATTPISVTYTATASSCTLANGSATISPLGGVAPYSIVWYTFPSNTSGPILSNRLSGAYQFLVTDANGCIRSGTGIIPPISSLSANIGNATVLCPATSGNLNVTASGSNPPFSYVWSNSATTANITGVPLGAYSCVITDAVGCAVTKYGTLSQDSPVIVGYAATPASCIFSANGSVLAAAMGGTPPYTYLWNNSQTGANATSLTTGYYYVTATDVNGCTNLNNNVAYVGYNSANTSCYCTITGTVYSDVNLNCIRDPGENGIANIMIQCSGNGYAYTNSNGIYSFKVPTGTYTVSEIIKQHYPLAGCQGGSQIVPVTAGAACVLSVNFANTITPVDDLHISIFNLNQPVPGSIYTQRVLVQNDATNTQNSIQIGYKHDGQLSYSNSIPWALVQQNSGVPTWYSITTGFPSLSADANSLTQINYNVPTNIPLGTSVSFQDSVARLAPIGTNWLSDVTPWNNLNYHQTVVVASYDPNFKEVSPQGSGDEGIITRNDSILTYAVHFQNTGSYFAQDIVVIDTIDTDLNIATLHPGYSDHPFTVSISETRVAKFSFDNINLAWKSAYGDAFSSGMFTYSIKVKNNLPVGTQIKNKAAIYFDYNEPVITNTTLNTIVQSTVRLEELNKAGVNRMVLYPNPSSSSFELLFESAKDARAQITLFDLSGRLLENTTMEVKPGANLYKGNTAQLQNGIYLVQLKTEGASLVGKLIVAR